MMVDTLSSYIRASLIKSLRPQLCNVQLRTLSVSIFSKALKHIFMYSWGQKRVSTCLNIYFIKMLKHEFKVKFVLRNCPIGCEWNYRRNMLMKTILSHTVFSCGHECAPLQQFLSLWVAEINFENQNQQWQTSEVLRSPLFMFLEKCFYFSFQHVLGEQSQNINILISPKIFSEILYHIKFWFFYFNLFLNENKKNQHFSICRKKKKKKIPVNLC